MIILVNKKLKRSHLTSGERGNPGQMHASVPAELFISSRCLLLSAHPGFRHGASRGTPGGGGGNNGNIDCRLVEQEWSHSPRALKPLLRG